MYDHLCVFLLQGFHNRLKYTTKFSILTLCLQCRIEYENQLEVWEKRCHSLSREWTDRQEVSIVSERTDRQVVIAIQWTDKQEASIDNEWTNRQEICTDK
jgi:hypothetical protein